MRFIRIGSRLATRSHGCDAEERERHARRQGKARRDLHHGHCEERYRRHDRRRGSGHQGDRIAWEIDFAHLIAQPHDELRVLLPKQSVKNAVDGHVAPPEPLTLDGAKQDSPAGEALLGRGVVAIGCHKWLFTCGWPCLDLVDRSCVNVIKIFFTCVFLTTGLISTNKLPDK